MRRHFIVSMPGICCLQFAIRRRWLGSFLLRGGSPTRCPTGNGVHAAEKGAEDGASCRQPLFNKGAYFIGKAVWGKGYSELLERLAEQKAVRDGGAMHIDVIGTGEDLGEARPVPLSSACLPCPMLWSTCCSLRVRA